MPAILDHIDPRIQGAPHAVMSPAVPTVPAIDVLRDGPPVAPLRAGRRPVAVAAPPPAPRAAWDAFGIFSPKTVVGPKPATGDLRGGSAASALPSSSQPAKEIK